MDYVIFRSDADRTWRDDLHPTDVPWGPGTIITYAEDPFASLDIYVVTIRHVVAYGGYKGFIATIRGPGSYDTGEVRPGTDVQAYVKAEQEGWELINAAVEKLNREVAAMCASSGGPNEINAR